MKRWALTMRFISAQKQDKSVLRNMLQMELQQTPPLVFKKAVQAALEQDKTHKYTMLQRYVKRAQEKNDMDPSA